MSVPVSVRFAPLLTSKAPPVKSLPVGSASVPLSTSRVPLLSNTTLESNPGGEKKSDVPLPLLFSSVPSLTIRPGTVNTEIGEAHGCLEVEESTTALSRVPWTNPKLPAVV